MSQLTKYQRDALLVLRTRLDPANPSNTAVDEVKAHLRAIQPWLDTWVLTAVDAIDSKQGYEDRWLREAVEREACYIRRAQEKQVEAAV